MTKGQALYGGNMLKSHGFEPEVVKWHGSYAVVVHGSSVLPLVLTSSEEINRLFDNS